MMFLTMSVISHWYYDAACGTGLSIMYIVTSVGGGGEYDWGQREKGLAVHLPNEK